MMFSAKPCRLRRSPGTCSRRSAPRCCVDLGLVSSALDVGSRHVGDELCQGTEIPYAGAQEHVGDCSKLRMSRHPIRRSSETCRDMCFEVLCWLWIGVIGAGRRSRHVGETTSASNRSSGRRSSRVSRCCHASLAGINTPVAAGVHEGLARIRRDPVGNASSRVLGRLPKLDEALDDHGVYPTRGRPGIKSVEAEVVAASHLPVRDLGLLLSVTAWSTSCKGLTPSARVSSARAWLDDLGDRDPRALHLPWCPRLSSTGCLACSASRLSIAGPRQRS